MGHRINPIGLRLNVMQSWDTTISPSKMNYINDFLFKYFLYSELYGFFSTRWISKLQNKFVIKIVSKLTRRLEISTKYKKTTMNSILYRLFFFKKFVSTKRALRQKENKLFFYIYDIFINLGKQNLQLDYCYFQKIIGNLNIKFYFKFNYLESEFYNYIRFSQKWLKIKLFSLLFFKVENYSKKIKIKNHVLYATLYKYDFKYKQNFLFSYSKNYSNSFYYLYSLFLLISKSFINYYLINFNFILSYMRKFILLDLSFIKKYKNINLELLLNSYSYSSNTLFAKYLKYRLLKYEGVGRVVNTFFFKILKIFKNMYKLRRSFFYCNFFLKKKKEKFYLMDNFNDFNGFIEIFGLKAFGSGRFTKKRRVRSVKYYKGAVPLNRFHRNITLDIVEIRLKYGISAVKLWVYKAPTYNYFY